MIEENLTVQSPHGLHARPAVEFVKAAQQFQSTVTVIKDGREANAKSLVSLLALGINQGSVINIQADGPDETVAVQTLSKLVAANG